ncbi:MAG: hypothetical protein AAB336_04825 [Acidobacteriota bacterium]
MRKISYNFLFVFGLMAIFVGVGIFSATTGKVSANAEDTKSTFQRLTITTNVLPKTNDEITKIPKNMGVISVTTDEPMSVFLDGVEIGRTQGNQVKFEKTVTPGIHEIRIVGADGKEFNKTYTFTKGVRNCVCLKTVTRTDEKDCPYNINVTGPDKVTEGDLITFAVFDAAAKGTALNYLWTVSPSTARVTSGLGTPSITVDTGDMGNQTIQAEVTVGDGVYDAQCSQRKSVTTLVERTPPVVTPTPYRFDGWDAKTFDDDKNRFDNLAIELQNKPDSQGYVIMYQGTDKISVRSRKVEKLSTRAINYLVKERFVPPNRLQFTNWGTRVHTYYEVWIVPPGANPPVPNE